MSVPGYVIPRDTTATLYLQFPSSIKVFDLTVEPPGSLTLIPRGDTAYVVHPNPMAWGRARVTVKYSDEKMQTVHYYITKPISTAVSDLGRFLTTKQWFTNVSDPFGRAPSIMGFDYEADAIVEQDSRVIVAGLSDEGGAGAYVAAAAKQVFQPNADEIDKLETFINEVLHRTVQNNDYTAKKSAFFYEPEVMPGYDYDPAIKWNPGSWSDRKFAYSVNRAYKYLWPASVYWSLYRAQRGYSGLLRRHDWKWYLIRAYKTALRATQADIDYSDAGLMGETVLGEILTDLEREGCDREAKELTEAMEQRVAIWETMEFPFGSEMSWDSTGQEGVYYWARHVAYRLIHES